MTPLTPAFIRGIINSTVKLSLEQKPGNFDEGWIYGGGVELEVIRGESRGRSRRIMNCNSKIINNKFSAFKGLITSLCMIIRDISNDSLALFLKFQLIL